MMKKLAASIALGLLVFFLTGATIALVQEDGQHRHLYLEATDTAIMTAVGRVTPVSTQNTPIMPSTTPSSTFIASTPTIEFSTTPLVPPPNIVNATNISGFYRNIRRTCTTSAEIMGTVAPDQTIQIYNDSLHFSDNYIWFQIVGTFYCIAVEQINPVQVYLRIEQ